MSKLSSSNFSMSNDLLASYGMPLKVEERLAGALKPPVPRYGEECCAPISEEMFKASLQAYRDNPNARYEGRPRPTPETLKRIYERRGFTTNSADSQDGLERAAIRAFADLTLEQKLAQPVEQLGLDEGHQNALTKSGRKTVGNVVNSTIEDLLSIKSFGLEALKQTIDRLKAIGIIEKNYKLTTGRIKTALYNIEQAKQAEIKAKANGAAHTEKN